MALDVDFRNGFESGEKDFSRIKNRILRQEGVHINNLGILGEELEVVESSPAGLSVDVKPGDVEFYSNDTVTVWGLSSDTTETLVIGSASHLASETRIDLITAKVDPSTRVASLGVVEGTPATTGSEVRPSVPSSSYVLASINIVGGITTITNSIIVDERQPITLNTYDSVTGWQRLLGGASFGYNNANSLKTTTDIDLTAYLSKGDKITFTQPTNGVKYGFITALDYNNTVAGRTYIEIYTGEDYGIDNESVANVFTSKAKSPTGFPLDPAKWTIEYIDTSTLEISSPVQNAWYNIGSAQISIPTGDWRVSFDVVMAVVGGTSVSVELSTSPSSAVSPEYRQRFQASGVTQVINSVSIVRDLSLTSQETRYLITRTESSGASLIQNRGGDGATIIRARISYL